MLLPIFLLSRNGIKNTGGVERVVHLLQNDLVAHGANVTLIDEAVVLPRILRGKRVAQFAFPIAVSLWLWIRRLRGGRKFLTISNSSFTPLYPADIVIAHGSAAGYMQALSQSGNRFLGMRLLALLEALSMRWARQVICVSEAVRDLCLGVHHIAPKKCVVIHNGIDTSVFYPQQKFADGIIRLGFAGRLEYGKGLPYLTEIAHWVGTQPEVRLVIATMSEVPPTLRDLPGVSVLQGLDPEKMSTFYDQIDILVLPSLFEGFELVTLEALASGVSVLGNRVGACDVFLRQNVPWVSELPRDPHSFFQQSASIFERLRQHYQPAAMHAFISESFSTQRFCDQVRAQLFS